MSAANNVMKSRILSLLSIVAFATSVSAQSPEIKDTAAGTTVVRTTAKKLAFHGSTPVAQRSGAAQAALTDSTGGSTAAATLASTVGVTTITFPVQLASMTTAAADLMTAYTPGFKFKVLAVDFTTTTIGAGSSASQTLNLAITGVAVTGGVIVPTLAGTNTLGKMTAGTAVTAANTGSASDTLSVKVAASGTVFTAGSGMILIRLQNMDTADAFARTAVLLNELRAGIVEKGLIKGGS